MTDAWLCLFAGNTNRSKWYTIFAITYSGIGVPVKNVKVLHLSCEIFVNMWNLVVEFVNIGSEQHE